MATEEQRMIEVKKRIATIRTTLVQGVEHPDNAAQQVCVALLDLVDLVGYFIQECEEE